MAEYERGRESTAALTEVRTVLSRAETALSYLESEQLRDGEANYPYLVKDEGEFFHADPDIADMIETLQETVRRLDKWRRTGSTRKLR